MNRTNCEDVGRVRETGRQDEGEWEKTTRGRYSAASEDVRHRSYIDLVKDGH